MKVLHTDYFKERDFSKLRKIVSEQMKYYKSQGYKTETVYTSLTLRKIKYYFATVKVRGCNNV